MTAASGALPSLDDLFREARASLRKETEAKAARDKLKAQQPTVRRQEAIEPSAIYANPDNWTRTRGVALIHRTSQSLIGNFWEWKHRTLPDTRRLVRSPVPIAVEALEEVDYGYFAEQPMLYHATPRAERSVEMTLDLLLDFPQVSAAQVRVAVHVVDSYTSRVELLTETAFVEENEALVLPPGTNILPVMNRACKLEIRSHLV